jgi:hypothetical protein
VTLASIVTTAIGAVLPAKPSTTEQMLEGFDYFAEEFTRLRPEILKTRSERPHPADYPGSWSDRQRAIEDDYRTRLDAGASLCLTHLNNIAAARRDAAEHGPVYTRLLAAKATLERQAAEMPDHRGIRDALIAVDHGFTVVAPIAGGFCPGMPAELRAALTDTCTHCGHASLRWTHPLPVLEAKMADIREVLLELPTALQSVHEKVAAPK